MHMGVSTVLVIYVNNAGANVCDIYGIKAEVFPAADPFNDFESAEKDK